MRCAGLTALLLGQLLALSHAIALKSAPASIRSDSDTDSHIITREGEGEGEGDGESHVERTGTMMDVDMHTDLDAESEVEADADLDATEHVSTVTLSPAQRAAAKSWLYTDDFWVEINMTRARETGMQLGMVVFADEEWKPVTITRVKKNGLVEEWNRAHPGKDVHVDDNILQVNHIQWHHNATSFQERICGQVQAAKKGVVGAKEMLTLHIVRPRQQSKKRFQYQREDVHTKMYSAEFTAKIPVPSTGGPFISEDVEMLGEMGWHLNSTIDWTPITITEILPGGLLKLWNDDHPDNVILAGDEIMGVNAVSWHHNSTIFLTRITQQFLATRHNPHFNGTLALSIRRPRPVQEAYDKLRSATEAPRLAAAAGGLATSDHQPGEAIGECSFGAAGHGGCCTSDGNFAEVGANCSLSGMGGYCIKGQCVTENVCTVNSMFNGYCGLDGCKINCISAADGKCVRVSEVSAADGSSINNLPEMTACKDSSGLHGKCSATGICITGTGFSRAQEKEGSDDEGFVGAED